VGEAGTGKGIVAEVLHATGGSADRPLIRIDCALSSAQSIRDGLLGLDGAGGTWVQQALGGTLLLEHLHGLTMPVQKELVSVLRNNGHSFRLICTSDEDLEKLTDEGRFNDELFYRVAALPVTLPPLRERIEDLPILVKHFTRGAANPNFEAALVEFAEDAMAQLRTYRWPGNLAELEQVVSKIVSTCESRVITAQQLPLRLREPDQWPKLEAYLAGQEKQYIEMVLHACGGDKGRAARVLGVGLSKLS
jgi:DNA-binding NtrC family response regulator